MSRRTATLVGAAAVFATGLALVAILLRTSGSEEPERSLLPPGRVLVVQGSLSPNAHLFGDVVTARVHASVDTRRIDPDDLVLTAQFDPYERVGPIRVERSDVGEAARLTHTLRLRCVEYLCTPKGQRLPIRFPPARLETTAAPRFSSPVRWPPLEVSSRINETELQAFRYRATLTPLPQPTYRIAPATLAGIAFGGAALLVVLALVLVARVAQRLRVRRRPELELPPLERALWYLDRATNGDERRRALELLATALEDGELAREARKLAWSTEAPEPAAAAALAERVREERRAA